MLFPPAKTNSAEQGALTEKGAVDVSFWQESLIASCAGRITPDILDEDFMKRTENSFCTKQREQRRENRREYSRFWSQKNRSWLVCVLKNTIDKRRPLRPKVFRPVQQIRQLQKRVWKATYKMYAHSKIYNAQACCPQSDRPFWVEHSGHLWPVYFDIIVIEKEIVGGYDSINEQDYGVFVYRPDSKQCGRQIFKPLHAK